MYQLCVVQLLGTHPPLESATKTIISNSSTTIVCLLPLQYWYQRLHSTTFLDFLCAILTAGYPLLNIIHFLVGALPAPPISPSTDCVFSTPSTVAWTANILSGIFGSGIAVFVCLAIEEWTRGSEEAYNLGAAATGALLFCLSPLAWEYSTGVEVFALNNLLVAVALYLTVRAIRAPSIKIARMGAVVSCTT